MQLTVLILYGLGLSFTGVLPPGIININTAIISVDKGRKKGIVFALGACLIVFFQTLIAILIAKHLKMGESVVLTIEKIAVFIFLALTIHFYLCAKRKPKPKPQSITGPTKTNAFWKGAFFSAINFFPIPYYIGWSKALNLSGDFDFDMLNIISFSLSVVAGTFIANYLYIIFFKRFNADAEKFSKYAHYSLALLTLLLAIIALIKINLT